MHGSGPRWQGKKIKTEEEVDENRRVGAVVAGVSRSTLVLKTLNN
jgi:hypothetical protein